MSDRKRARGRAAPEAEGGMPEERRRAVVPGLGEVSALEWHAGAWGFSVDFDAGEFIIFDHPGHIPSNTVPVPAAEIPVMVEQLLAYYRFYQSIDPGEQSPT